MTVLNMDLHHLIYAYRNAGLEWPLLPLNCSVGGTEWTVVSQSDRSDQVMFRSDHSSNARRMYN